MISVKGLDKFFNRGKQNEVHVINDVSLTLPEKGMVAVFGKSGCGKTTLLNVIGGLDGFSSGEVLIEGKSIREKTDDIRNEYIGYIFQNYNLISSESCFDNVAAALRLCGMRDEVEIEKRTMAALRGVGMESYRRRTPDTLSGGQQQRIAIARAIVKSPRIILADEPTGNLDEANTVMIMDLLKAISKEHLVILVTHEANLVDYYCDTVIELSDGKIKEIKNNSLAGGFVARDKNDIYLGELGLSELGDENAVVEYYGDKPSDPIRLKIINNAGKIYVKIETEKVHILDESSEIRLREGVYEERERVSDGAASSFDTSDLSPVEKGRCGSLFSFKGALRRAYAENFGKNNKKKRVLKRFMALFASVVVFISAIFGTAFKDIEMADGAYNHNVFYIYTPDGTVSDKLLSALENDESGIDYIRLISGYPGGDLNFSFRAGSFETFNQFEFSTLFSTNAVMLDSSLLSGLKLLEGKKDDLSDSEIVITSRVAEALIEKSSLGYIEEPRDLLGLLLSSHVAGSPSPRIAGVVESDETAIYMNSLMLARYMHSSTGDSYVALASDYGVSVNSGEAVLAIRYEQDVDYPTASETVKIGGIDFEVVSVRRTSYSYDSWLSLNEIKKLSAGEYFMNIVTERYPDISADPGLLEAELLKARNENLYSYYDYYYGDIDLYYEDVLFFDSFNFDVWMYVEKGVEAAKFIYLPEDYYKAWAFKQLHGNYPTVENLNAVYGTLPSLGTALEEYYSLYGDEYYSREAYSIGTVAYLVSDEDYLLLSKRTGETHPSAKNNYNYGVYFDEEADYYNSYYTLIHSSDPEKTDAWLRAEFRDLTIRSEYMKPILSPTDIYEEMIASSSAEILGNIIAMVVIIAIICTCMYFIMHASVMNRIKEIGIYRAIGVSRKNLIFRFFTESALLSALTVALGYAFSSILIGVMTGGSSMVSSILYYPAWLAISVFAVITSITMLFGTLPIVSLLFKSPSRILAKYDI